MNPSPIGDGQQPPEPLAKQFPQTVTWLKLEIGKMTDCLQRASDGLDRDDAATVDWSYVAGQLVRVLASSDACVDQCQILAGIEVDDNDSPDTPTHFPSSDPFLPLPGHRDDEGGVA